MYPLTCTGTLPDCPKNSLNGANGIFMLIEISLAKNEHCSLQDLMDKHKKLHI